MLLIGSVTCWCLFKKTYWYVLCSLPDNRWIFVYFVVIFISTCVFWSIHAIIYASRIPAVIGSYSLCLFCLRKHTLGDNSFGANPFGAPATNSNFNNGNAIGFQKASGVVTHAVRVGFEDITQFTRSFEEVHINFPLVIHSSINNIAIKIPFESKWDNFAGS